MKQPLLLILTILTLTSCDRSKTVTDDWSDGRKVIKEYPDYQDTTTYHRKFYYSNGHLETKGKYVDGEKHGVWQWWYDNGQLKDSGRYEHGKGVGQFVCYHENGHKQGVQKIYYQDGTLSEKTNFSDGQKQGTEILYYKNGQPEFYRTFENDTLHGEYKEFHDNGELMVTGQHEKGDQVGLWTWYNKDGTIETTEEK